MTKQTGLLEFLGKRQATLPEETVHVPAWDRDVVLRGLSSRERDEFEATNLRRSRAKAGNGSGARRRGAEELDADLTNFRGRLVARHIVEGGMRVFANERGEELLGDQPAAVIDPLFAVAQRLSGFSNEDIQALEKNSAATGASEPSSDSPGSSDAPSKNSETASPIAN